MSILIKGMEMPTSCVNCRFSGFGGLRNERVVCMHTGSNAYMNEVRYLDDCPLVSVPPHGDLIDRDALLQEHERIVDSWGLAHIVSAQAIRNAPTIIQACPAEEGE